MGIDDRNAAEKALLERMKEANECLKEEVRHVKKLEAVRKAAMRGVLAFLILLIVIVHYLYFSSPGWVVVNRFGEIHGLTNQVRETLQGKKFWRDQLQEVRREIRWEEFGMLRRAANEGTLEKIGRDTNREMEKFFRRYPQVRPSKAELNSEAWRGKSHPFKWTKFNPLFEEMREKRFQELRKILPIVQSKAE